ncbi:hypothetical protein V3C99_011342 [Haemonchus contortus]
MAPKVDHLRRRKETMDKSSESVSANQVNFDQGSNAGSSDVDCGMLSTCTVAPEHNNGTPIERILLSLSEAQKHVTGFEGANKRSKTIAHSDFHEAASDAHMAESNQR